MVRIKLKRLNMSIPANWKICPSREKPASTKIVDSFSGFAGIVSKYEAKRAGSPANFRTCFDSSMPCREINRKNCAKRSGNRMDS